MRIGVADLSEKQPRRQKQRKSFARAHPAIEGQQNCEKHRKMRDPQHHTKHIGRGKAGCFIQSRRQPLIQQEGEQAKIDQRRPGEPAAIDRSQHQNGHRGQAGQKKSGCGSHQGYSSCYFAHCVEN